MRELTLYMKKNKEKKNDIVETSVLKIAQMDLRTINTRCSCYAAPPADFDSLT
jgi:hypothetical protein